MKDYDKETTQYLLELLISKARISAVTGKEEEKIHLEEINKMKKVILGRVFV